jgi:2,3-bisphosphoglycerate-independent phosphoglycerate mutase
VTGQPNTAHTINPVPFVFVNQMAKTIQKNVDWPKVPELGISSIAPTILEFMKLDKPAEMTSKLIKQIFADSKNT